jgi:hypothetical protein
MDAILSRSAAQGKRFVALRRQHTCQPASFRYSDREITIQSRFARRFIGALQ